LQLVRAPHQRRLAECAAQASRCVRAARACMCRMRVCVIVRAFVRLNSSQIQEVGPAAGHDHFSVRRVSAPAPVPTGG
jgi:hypothetical protein